MYNLLLFLHSLLRWLLLTGILFTLYRAVRGYYMQLPFSKTDDRARHWTATIAHLQLLIGMILYFRSPLIKELFNNPDLPEGFNSVRFFGWVHAGAMLLAIILLSIGSSIVKRTVNDPKKFLLLIRWYGFVLILILVMIPWPFSPLAMRPYFRFL